VICEATHDSTVAADVTDSVAPSPAAVISPTATIATAANTDFIDPMANSSHFIPRLCQNRAETYRRLGP
jgi:hypothetical protein